MGIAGASGPNHIGAQHGLPRCSSPPKRRLGLADCRISGQPVKRGSRGDTLKRPWRWKVTSSSGGAGEIGRHDRVAKFSGAAGGAAVDASTEHQPAADAGAGGKHDKIFRDHLKPVIMSLSECRNVGVVIDEHWNAERLSQQPTERNAGERQVDRCGTRPSLEFDHRRHAHSNCVELAAPHALHERNQLVEHCLLTGVVGDLNRRRAELSTAQGCWRQPWYPRGRFQR